MYGLFGRGNMKYTVIYSLYGLKTEFEFSVICVTK